LDPQQYIHSQMQPPLSSDSELIITPSHQGQSSKLVFVNEVVDPVNFAILRIKGTLHVFYSLPIHVQNAISCNVG
jgi:hypothetical protein